MSFSLYWAINGVSHSKDFATRRNIKKLVLFPRYQGSVGETETVCGYVGSKEINPSSTLSLIKSEDSIVENSSSKYSGRVIWEGKTGYVSARYLLLTDVIGNYTSATAEPFFWKHVLPDADIDPGSVAILDQNLNEVNEESYTAVRTEARDVSDVIVSGTYESCAVFSNYTNSYNRETGATELYFVRYAVSGSTHYQVLNSESAFTEASLDDVSLVTGQLKTWRKVYIINPGTSFFTITTPQANATYYSIPLERSRIIVRDPVDRSDEAPWFLNISNGSFSTLRGGLNYIYSIPEFAGQSFSPLYPYKVEVDELAEYIRPDIIKVDQSPLKVDAALYTMDILVKNSSGEVLYALTTDISKDGNFYEENGERVFRTIETENAWVTWDVNGIAGWDSEGGFIHLQREYADTRYFYVSYYYEETGYDLTSLNVNPVFDEEFNRQFYVLYIVPVGGDNSNVGQTVSIQYIKVDRSGRIIEASQDGTGGNIDISTYINVGEQYMYYSLNASSSSSASNLAGQNYIDVSDASGFPASGILTWVVSGVTYYKPYDTIVENRIYFQSGYTLSVDVTGSPDFYLHSFITPYTTASTNAYQWLILSEVHSDSSSRVDELSIIDLRVPGGVVKDKYRDDALAIDSRAVWAHPEIVQSRGQIVPGESVVIVKVPYTILIEYGGTFTKEQVVAIVKERHLAVGVFPVVIFHGAIPEISSIASSSDSISVCWSSEGSDYGYNIYYSSMKNGPWTLVNSSVFSDQIYGNSYTISGLSSGIIYYIAIASVDSNGVEGPKSHPWGIKTRV